MSEAIPVDMTTPENLNPSDMPKKEETKQDSIPNSSSSKKSRAKKIIIGLCGLCMLTIIGVLSYFLLIPKDDVQLLFEDNATAGIMPGVDLEQRRRELQEQLDKNMIAFSINTSPIFQATSGTGNLMVENPGNNAKLISVQLQLNDTNDVIYTSKYIKPGSYMEDITLDKLLEPGTYEATAYFMAYTEDTAEYIGQTGASVLLTVQ